MFSEVSRSFIFCCFLTSSDYTYNLAIMPSSGRRKNEVPAHTLPEFCLGDTAEDIERRRKEKEESEEREQWECEEWEGLERLQTERTEEMK